VDLRVYSRFFLGTRVGSESWRMSDGVEGWVDGAVVGRGGGGSW